MTSVSLSDSTFTPLGSTAPSCGHIYIPHLQERQVYTVCHVASLDFTNTNYDQECTW